MGYYDDDLGAGVHCVRAPARLQNAAGSRCNIVGMGFGMKAQVSIEASAKKTAQLGTMVQFLAGVDTGLIAAADYNDACMQFFALAKALGGADHICGSSVKLFGRASTAEHAILLGTATLQCHGKLCQLPSATPRHRLAREFSMPLSDAARSPQATTASGCS